MLSASLLALVLTPASLSAGPPAPGLQEPVWHAGSFEEALTTAAEGKTLVTLYFYLEGSEHCRRMDETLAGAGATLEPLVCKKVDAASADGAALLGRYGVQTLPTLVFVGGDGSAEDALVGFYDVERLAPEVARIRGGRDTTGALRGALERSPADHDLRLRYALKLQHVGDLDGYRRELATIAERDPEGQTLAGARVALWQVMSDVRDAAPDPNQSSTYDLTPLREHLRGVKQASVLREGWEWVAQVEQMRGDRSAARKALMQAEPHVADADRVAWSRQTVYSFFGMRDELDAGEREFTLELATRTLELGEARKLSPAELAVVRVSRARALAMNARLEDAAAETRRALALAPDLTEARMFLGWLDAN